MLAKPTAPSKRHRTLMPIASQMFSLTMRRHLREILMPLAIFRGSSSMRTISAASMAASDPMAPIAMPISARDKTGASLIPSPTKASFPDPVRCASSFSTAETLSEGISSQRTSSMPNCEATARATLLRSPVSMTTLLTPAFLTASIALIALGFS